MSEEELEKEVKEKTKHYMNEYEEKYNCENTKLETDNYNAGLEQGYEDGFNDGAEFGYNKANEWHFIKDGKLPKDESRVWLYFGNDDYNDGQFIRNRFWCGSSGWFDVDEVVAWQELVPPKDGE